MQNMPYKSSKKRTTLLLIILGLLGAIALSFAKPWSHLGARPVAEATYQPHWDLSPTLATYRISTDGTGFVSIAPFNDTTFFACDYGRIFLLTEEQTAQGDKSYALKTLQKPAAVDFWNPTGLFFKADTQTLYVANYNGHDILKFSYDAQQQSLSLQQTITDPQMVSPENLYVRDSGDIFAADYDGSAVYRFAPDGTRLWRQEVAQAHGITGVGDTIYATSTADRSVVKLNSDGKILKTAGQLGTDLGDYVWPITITALKNGQLAVTDPQTGRISIINEQLEVLKVIGANGPGIDLLNYPYALIQLTTGELLLADTYKWRVLRLTEDWTVTEQLVSKIDSAGQVLTPVIPAEDKPYTYPSFPGVNIHKQLGIDSLYSAQAMGGFNAITYDADATHVPSDRSAQTHQTTADKHSTDASGFRKRVALSFPQSPYAINTGYWYTLWAKLVAVPDWGDLIVVSSPQSIYVLVIDPLTGGWSRVDIELATFPYEDDILSPGGEPLDLVQTVAPAVEKFKALRALLDSGQPRTEAYQQTFASDIKEFLSESDQSVWAAILSSTEAGKTFYNRYSQDPKQVKDLAAAYFGKTLPQPDNAMFEILAVNYLAGGQAFQLSQIDTQLKVETSLEFYPDHGLENAIAEDPSINGYVSADENQAPYRFTIKVPDRIDTNRIDTKNLVLSLEWLDASNYPTRYTLKCFAADQTLLTTVPVVDNTDTRNVVSLSTATPITRIEVSIEKFEGKQRLLLRNIDVLTLQS